MSSTIPILRARRERRLARQRMGAARTRNTFLSVGMILSLLIAALIIGTAFTCVNVTRGLPSVEILPAFLNPPDGLLLQPTRIYDRTGKNILFTFAPASGVTLPRRYIPLGDTNPQYIPKSLSDAVIATTDPNFWKHSGYTLNTITNYELHSTSPNASSSTFSSSMNLHPSVAPCGNASLRHRSLLNMGARKFWSGISTRQISVAMPLAPMPPRSSTSASLPRD